MALEVLVEVWAENIVKGTKVHALMAYFVMVAVDEMGKPAEVPPLILSSNREKALWEKGKKRYQACKGGIMSADADYQVCREESV